MENYASIEIAAYDTEGFVDGVCKAKRLDYTEQESMEFRKFLVDHGYKEVRTTTLFKIKV